MSSTHRQDATAASHALHALSVPDDLITYEQLAAKLDLSLRATYRLVKARKLRKIPLNKKEFRFDWAEIVRQLKEGV